MEIWNTLYLPLPDENTSANSFLLPSRSKSKKQKKVNGVPPKKMHLSHIFSKKKTKWFFDRTENYPSLSEGVGVGGGSQKKIETQPV